ncbi:Clavaminate synthase-like protein [Apiospora arundinis]
MSKGTVINHSIMAIQPTETPAVAAVAQPEKTIVPAELSMNLPIVDLDVFLQKPRDAPEVLAECQKAANALITYGALVLHDSRVSEDDNTTFLDLLEDYFAQSEDDLRRDERPELGYQIGVTLENTEKPKCAVDEPCLQVIERLDPAERPLDIKAHEPDPQTQFPSLNAENITPEAPHIQSRWAPTMDQWGTSMKNAVTSLAGMTAVGLGLPAEAFMDATKYGPHLLAPTASDLSKYGKKDSILAGFHTDLNFLTIHGRSRYPGLHIWARNTGKRIPVKIPQGNYLLVQAGKQIEHLTGGLIKAGYHEVGVNQATLDVIERRKADFPDRPLVRISSTFFCHLSSDYDLAPNPVLADRARRIRAEQFNLGKDEGEEVLYHDMKVGQQVQEELKHIALMT